MAESMDAMQVALRVVIALSEKHEPYPADVDALRRFAPLLPDTAPIDEVACEVIQQALRVRAIVRGSGER